MKLKKAKRSVRKAKRSISKVIARVKKSIKGKPAVASSKKISRPVAEKEISLKPVRLKTILITQAKPEGDKNPFSDLSNRCKVQIDFKPFIHLVGIGTREYRRFKINPLHFQAVIFTSRNMIDHFFKLCEDLRIRMPEEQKFYCISESVALYLQKYIQYRKRKVFYGDGTLPSFYKCILHHQNEGEKFLLPCADIHKSDIPDFLKANNIPFAEATILKTVPMELKKKDIEYDAIIFFAPAGVNALLHNFSGYKQKQQVIGGFGPMTLQAIEDSKLRCDIKAPTAETPSMVMAIEKYISDSGKK